MNEPGRDDNKVSIASDPLWLGFEEELRDLRTYNADLAALGEQHRAERDAARGQVEALRRALAALRALSAQTSDALILRTAIDELADSAGAPE
jgi:hypothetical protein